MKRAVVLVGHGSKVENAGDALERVSKSLQKTEPGTIFRVAFLEITPPSISEAVESCLAEGSSEVVVLPYFVQSGKHVNQHIPGIVSELQARYPAQSIKLARHLDFDERIAALVGDRIEEARRAGRKPRKEQAARP